MVRSLTKNISIFFFCSEEVRKELSVKILFSAGPQMYLGFLIHVFLHFVIIQKKISQQPGSSAYLHQSYTQRTVNEEHFTFHL